MSGVVSGDLIALREAHRQRIARFGALMGEKLDRHAGKGDWRLAAPDEEWVALDRLIGRIRDEIVELEHELMRPVRDIAAAQRECADIANFALIIADLLKPLDVPDFGRP